jgi:hypothetical protein
LKKIYVLLALVIFSASCEKEETLEIHDESSSKHFSTVSQKNAIDFLKNLKKSNLNKQAELNIHYDQLHYVTINNSTELLTVIPAKSKYTEVDSRVLVLEVNGNIEPVLFNLVPEIQNNDTLFTGKIIISNLDLKFITGFRVKNGNLITRFVKKEKFDNSSKYDEGGWAGIDMGCNQTLDEVILESSSPTKTP